MRRRVFAALLALPLLPAGLASACPNCKDSIPSNDAPQSAGLPGGFNTSIYFMLGSVGLVGAFVVRMIVKETRS